MLNRINQQKGFTLLEMTVTIGLSSMIAFAFFHVMRNGTFQSESADVQMKIQENSREALYKTIQELRMTSPSRVTFGTGCNSITFNVPNPSTPVNTTSYVVNWPGHQIQYAISGNQLVRTNVTTSQSSVVASDVTSVMFTTDTTSPFTCSTTASPTTITAVINVQRTLKNGRAVPVSPLQVAGQARIRNTG